MSVKKCSPAVWWSFPVPWTQQKPRTRSVETLLGAWSLHARGRMRLRWCRFKKLKIKSAWRLPKQVVEGSNSLETQLGDALSWCWYVQGFIWQHMRLKTKTLSYDTPTWDSCLLDRAQRREHPLDRCCNIHWTASNRSTAWLTIKCCQVCETSTPIFLYLPWYILILYMSESIWIHLYL